MAGHASQERKDARGPSRLRRGARSGAAAGPPRPRIAGHIAQLLLMMALIASLLFSVPALRPVIRTIGHMNVGWIAVAVALELASCLSFVVLFRLFFDRLPSRDARALAWTEMASGALLPGGGAGGLAIGAWLMHVIGVPTDWIIRRSGGLFFLTSAVNGASLIIAGLLLAAGTPGPHALTLTLLPTFLATVITIAIAALPRILRSRSHPARWLAGVSSGVEDAEQTTFAEPSWRLIGALGYLGFDMAVLWVTLKAVGDPISAPALVMAYNIGYLANALPVPGGIGALDAGLAGSLLLYGAPPGHVAAAVLVYHTIALWLPGLGGTVAYLGIRSRLTSRQAEPEPVWQSEPQMPPLILAAHAEEPPPPAGTRDQPDLGRSAVLAPLGRRGRRRPREPEPQTASGGSPAHRVRRPSRHLAP